MQDICIPKKTYIVSMKYSYGLALYSTAFHSQGHCHGGNIRLDDGLGCDDGIFIYFYPLAILGSEKA